MGEPLCDGSRDCPATTHRHGCYADRGDCDSPGSHTDEVAILWQRIAVLEKDLAHCLAGEATTHGNGGK